jgi:hypothetical protein
MERLRRSPGAVFGEEAFRSACAAGGRGMERSLDFEEGAFPVLQHRRKVDGRDFYWLANNSDQARDCVVRFRRGSGAVTRWDCETGAVRRLAGLAGPDGLRCRLSFAPFEAYWIALDPSDRTPAAEPPRFLEVAALEVPGPWRVSVDTAGQPVLERRWPVPGDWISGRTAGRLEPWRAWGLGGFTGFVEYEAEFGLDAVPDSTLLDLGRVLHVASVTVNDLDAGMRLWPPHRFGLCGKVRAGRNVLRIRVGNLAAEAYGHGSESGLLGPVRVVAYRREPAAEP